MSDKQTRNAQCPACGGRHLDREDRCSQIVYRRIEAITETEGSIYGLRAMSCLPDRPTGMTGRKGVAIRCADCGWRVETSNGDKYEDPEHQVLLSRLRTPLVPREGA